MSDQPHKGFLLTQRDLETLLALERYRYLRTGQIQSLVFSQNKSIQSTRRRLRILLKHGYVGRIDPFVQVGKGNAESAYHILAKGTQLLSETLETFQPASYAKTDKVKTLFLQHTLDNSEFRKCLEISLRKNTVADLHRYVADFELKSHAQKLQHQARHKIYQEVQHPQTSQTYTVYPDSLIILKGKGNYESYRKLYFLEIDRATESLKVLQKKLLGYHLYAEQGLFKKYGKFSDFRVLFQAPSKKRADNIREAFLGMQGHENVWVTEQQSVTPDSILNEPIWKDTFGNSHAILK